MHAIKTCKTFILFFAFAYVCGAISARAQCGPGSGLTFNENWTTGSDPYVSGGASTAKQTWSLASGSGQSLLSSGLPGSGWNNTSILKMPPVSGGVVLTSLGTMPYVSNSSLSYDLYWEMYISSHTFASGDPLIELNYNGAGTNAFVLYTQSSGTTGYYINGATAFTASQATYHCWHLHQVSGSTCELQIDGGTYTTFTCAIADFNQISVGGHSGATGETVYIGNVQLVVSGVTVSPWPPSALFDAGGGTNGGTPTATTLLSSIHGSNEGTSNLTPSISGSGSDTLTYSTSHPCPTFASHVTVGGTAYTGNSGLTLDHHIPSGVSPGLIVEYPMGTSYANVAVGFCFGTFYTGTSTTFDAAGVTNIMVVNICDSTSTTTCSGSSGLTNHLICLESLYEGADQGCLQISNNTLYWLSFELLSGTTPITGDYMYVYNLNSNGTVGSLVGSITQAASQGWASWANNDAFACGTLGSAAPTATVDSVCGNVIFQYADEAFPVLPPLLSFLNPPTSSIF